MKKLAETIAVQEVPNEGLISLLGERVLFYCLNYIYVGKLSGVNTDCVLLTDASIVYEVGNMSDKSFGTAQKIGSDLYIQKNAIEVFFKTDK